MSNQSYFTKQLLAWHRQHNTRDLPWKEEKDPYRIWLSEVILQQTRAEQGRRYYLGFIQAYPTISDLALANEEAVFRLWQGLGYYNRCRNMLATAQYIHHELKGVFPDWYEDILALKGVGAYTAAAISSFAFNLPFAVLDGNVYRVLSRYFGLETPIDSTAGKKLFSGLAQELLDPKQPAAYNQAIMDLGATICTPRSPRCEACPLNKHCVARRSDLVSLLPVKQKKMSVVNRYFNFIVPEYKGKVWIQQRTAKDIWQSLYQFYLVESDESISVEELERKKEYSSLFHVEPEYKARYSQRLTHQLIESKLYRLVLDRKPSSLPADGIWVPLERLRQYAFPKTLVQFLQSQGLA